MLDPMFYLHIYYCTNTVPSSPPRSVQGQAVNSRQIFLSWDLPEPTGRNGIIISHTILVLEIITDSVLTYNVTNRTAFLIEQLHPHYDYRCSVAASTAVGIGPFSAPFVVKTDEDSEPVYELNLKCAWQQG